MKETDFQNGRTQQQVGELLEFTLGTGVLLFTFSPCIHSMAQSRVRVHTLAPDLTKVSLGPCLCPNTLDRNQQSHQGSTSAVPMWIHWCPDRSPDPMPRPLPYHPTNTVTPMSAKLEDPQPMPWKPQPQDTPTHTHLASS